MVAVAVAVRGRLRRSLSSLWRWRYLSSYRPQNTLYSSGDPQLHMISRVVVVVKKLAVSLVELAVVVAAAERLVVVRTLTHTVSIFCFALLRSTDILLGRSVCNSNDESKSLFFSSERFFLLGFFGIYCYTRQVCK